MTKISFSIKSLIFAIVIGISLLLCSNTWAFVKTTNNGSTWADTAINSQVITGFANGNFESYSGSSTEPMTPSSWSFAGQQSNNKDPKSGLITLNPNTLTTKQKESIGLKDYDTPPLIDSSKPNNKVLMINSNGNSLYYGYESNAAVELEANSYYKIDALVYVDNATASLYLTGDDFNDLNSSKICVTSGNGQKAWHNVTFFVSTSSFKKSSVKIQLYIGQRAHISNSVARVSDGFVLFDDVQVTRLSGSEYVLNKASSNAINTEIDLSDTAIAAGDGFVQNGNFVNGSTNWTEDDNSLNGRVIFTNSLNITQTLNKETVTFGTRQSVDNNKNAVILSVNNGYVSIKSADISIKQHQLYKISFWAKGKLTSGSANFVLGGNLPESIEETYQSVQITGLSTSTESINNNWGLYEFFVEGNPLSDATINLNLGLGTKDSSATGYVAITDIKSYLISSDEMTSNKSINSDAKTLSLYPSSTLSFANYAFNLVDLDSAGQVTYPLTPKNWTSQNSNNTKSGVVNIESSIWSSQANLSNIDRPYKTSNFSDNVLMLNTENDYQSYKSDSQTLSSSGYALISFDANVKKITKGKAYVLVKNSDNIVLAQINLTSKTNNWENYKIYLHNYLKDQTITLTLGFGEQDSPAIGQVYFDNCKFDSSITEETFNGIVANEKTIVQDFNKDLLSLTSTDNKEPLLWEFSIIEDNADATIKNGIINTDDFNNAKIGGTNPGMPTDSTSTKVLVINSSSPIYAQYSSKLKYTFSASTYYKISIYVKTSDLTVDEIPAYTEDGFTITRGASILLKNMDQQFTGINTKNSLDQNEWKNYIFYIYTTEDTESEILLGLGCENMPTAGFAYFADLSVSQLSEDEYKNEILLYDEENLPDNVLLATNTPEDGDDSHTTGFGSVDPFAISTIIIAAAVVVAIIGVLIRRFHHARPKKAAVVNNNYDRLQTLLKDVDRRERKTAINHKIQLLQEELEQSEKFLEQEKADLKAKTDSFNTAKEIAKDNPNVELDAPDVKQIIKNIDTQTAKIEQIENDIRILEEEKAKINKQAKKAIEKTDK